MFGAPVRVSGNGSWTSIKSCWEIPPKPPVWTLRESPPEKKKIEMYYRLQWLKTPENYKFYFNSVLRASASVNSWRVVREVQLGSQTPVMLLVLFSQSGKKWEKKNKTKSSISEMKVESLPSDEQQDFPISFQSNQPATLDILLLSNFPLVFLFVKIRTWMGVSSVCLHRREIFSSQLYLKAPWLLQPLCYVSYTIKTSFAKRQGCLAASSCPLTVMWTSCRLQRTSHRHHRRQRGRPPSAAVCAQVAGVWAEKRSASIRLQ